MAGVRPHPAETSRSPHPLWPATSRSAEVKRGIYLKVLPVAGAAALTVGVAGSFDAERSAANWLIAAGAGVALLAATAVLAARPRLLAQVERSMVACAVAAYVAALVAAVAASALTATENVDGVIRIGIWTAAIAGFAHLALPARAAALLSLGLWALLAVASGAVLAIVRGASVSDRTTLIESLLVQGCAVVIIGGIVRVTRAERERASTMAHMAGQDVLTGLVNRRVGEEVLAREVARARRYAQPLSVAWMDLDRFKQVNDRYGHDVGDGVLTAVARVVLTAVRDHDTVARWGGEEFIIVFPGQAEREAHVATERVRDLIGRLDARLPGDERVTASFGVAELAPGETASELVRRADLALLSAKGGGRDRVVLAHAADGAASG